jgi:hypothetical protein
MNPLVNLLARLELILQQADAAINDLTKENESLKKERDELKHLLETKGGES